MDWSWLALVIVFFTAGLALWRRSERRTADEPAKFRAGDITAETLAYYAGYDYTKPILVAVRGEVFDVTPAADQFAPGKPLHVYAGKEVARALALGSTDAKDCGSDIIHDLDAAAADRLTAKLQEFRASYDLCGQVVPLKQLTLAELALHDGVAEPSRPLYLAIKGTVYDVSKGSMFYGPEGVYPFAGKECARALALMSTELSDCTADLEDLGYTELQNLREWEAKFSFKYPTVGKLVPGRGGDGGNLVADGRAATAATAAPEAKEQSYATSKAQPT